MAQKHKGRGTKKQAWWCCTGDWKAVSCCSLAALAWRPQVFMAGICRACLGLIQPARAHRSGPQNYLVDYEAALFDAFIRTPQLSLEHNALTSRLGIVGCRAVCAVHTLAVRSSAAWIAQFTCNNYRSLPTQHKEQIHQCSHSCVSTTIEP